MEYKYFFNNSLNKLKLQKEYRFFNEIYRHANNYPYATLFRRDKSFMLQQVSVWCSNDYLGMGQCPRVVDIMKKTLDETGTGSGGTRNISGTTKWHVLLEKILSSFHKKESALLFTSGYVANETALRTLGGRIPGCIILSDEHNHASMIQGIRDSGAHKCIFSHNDMFDLENILRSFSFSLPKIIAFESVYSMSGSVSNLKKITSLAKRYNALTYLDEVHGVGLYGEKGSGQAEKQGYSDDIDIIQGTLGKAIGLVGGYVVSNTYIIDYIRSYAPGFIFTTSLPPSIVAGACESLKIIQNGNCLRQKQRINVLALKFGLLKL